MPWVEIIDADNAIGPCETDYNYIECNDKDIKSIKFDQMTMGDIERANDKWLQERLDAIQ